MARTGGISFQRLWVSGASLRTSIVVAGRRDDDGRMVDNRSRRSSHAVRMRRITVIYLLGRAAVVAMPLHVAHSSVCTGSSARLGHGRRAIERRLAIRCIRGGRDDEGRRRVCGRRVHDGRIERRRACTEGDGDPAGGDYPRSKSAGHVSFARRMIAINFRTSSALSRRVRYSRGAR